MEISDLSIGPSTYKQIGRCSKMFKKYVLVGYADTGTAASAYICNPHHVNALRKQSKKIETDDRVIDIKFQLVGIKTSHSSRKSNSD
jgi:hypothetical protein